MSAFGLLGNYSDTDDEDSSSDETKLDEKNKSEKKEDEPVVLENPFASSSL